MNIGVYIGSLLPEVGGGYLYQKEVLQTLILYGLEGRHNFTFYGKAHNPPFDFIGDKNTPYFSLSQTSKEMAAFKRRTWKKAIKHKCRYPRSKFHIPGKYNSFIQYAFESRNIHFMWYLTLECITTEIPYLVVSWDLQHRLQPYFPEVSKNGQWKEREEVISTVLRRAAYIITGTEIGKQEIETFFHVPSARIKVVPFSTPSYCLVGNKKRTDFSYIKEKYDLSRDYLLYPAQFWPHKNHIGLLLAVKHLRDKFGLTFPVVFVGSFKGRNQPYVKRCAEELGLGKHVHFLGFLPQKDLVSLYQNAFALVFTSFFGPDNLPPLEAFALGCPVISSSVSGAEEQLGDSALLVDPKNEFDIAEKIKRLYGNSELRQQLVEKAKIRAMKYTAKDYISAVISIFDDFEPIRRCWGNL